MMNNEERRRFDYVLQDVLGGCLGWSLEGQELLDGIMVVRMTSRMVSKIVSLESKNTLD